MNYVLVIHMKSIVNAAKINKKMTHFKLRG